MSDVGTARGGGGRAIVALGDERAARGLACVLEELGWSAVLLEAGRAWSGSADLALVDVDAVGAWREAAPGLGVIAIDASESARRAVLAVRAGAIDYLAAPSSLDGSLAEALERAGRERPEGLSAPLSGAAFDRLYETCARIAATLELSELYAITVRAIAREVGARGVALWVRTHSAPARYECAHAEPAPAGMLGVEGGHIAALERGEALALGDEVSGWRAALGLRAKGELVGFVVASLAPGEVRLRREARRSVAIVCDRAGAAIENAGLHRSQQESFKQTIQALANLLEDKDPYTHGHSQRVGEWSRMIAVEMGLGEREVEAIADCALMHDIGKLGIRNDDLNKTEPLSAPEYEMFKSHTTRGKWILEPIPFLRHLIPGVYHHHERWDGAGYPLGLKGASIPLVARILAVADTYDAMTSSRAYRRALPHEVAMRELREYAGAQFDPEVVAAFERAVERSGHARQTKQERWAMLAAPTITDR